MKTRQLNLENLILQTLTQPTAPFRESWVKRSILSACVELKLPYFEDFFGNYWIGAQNQKQLKKKSLVWVAHLDHPGIVIDRFQKTPTRIIAHGRWLGGGPMDIRNKSVKIFSHVDALVVLHGKITHTTKGARSVDKVRIEVERSPLAEACASNAALKSLGPWGACLWYENQGAPQGIAKVKSHPLFAKTTKDTLWITKAADDLIGVCALLHAFASTRPKNAVALLSRAEESGFHGSLAVLEKELLDPVHTQMISIETSSRLPGAEPGLGPVVRLGDRMGIFDSEMVEWISAVAKKSKLPFQQRIMDGGTCEASAFKLYGFKVGGLSTPLLNYHNITTNQKAAPEAVAVKDVEVLTKLIANLLLENEKTPGTKKFWSLISAHKKRLLKNHEMHLKFE